MESRLWLLLAALAIITWFLHTGEALQCHQCTSLEDSLCQDPFNEEFYSSNSSSKFLRKCANPAAQFCRKVSQYVRGVETVIRDCGVKTEKKNTNYCYRTVAQEFNTLSCQCWEDACNGAKWTKISGIVMAFCSVGALLF